MPARDLGKAKFKHSELASHFALLIGGHGLRKFDASGPICPPGIDATSFDLPGHAWRWTVNRTTDRSGNGDVDTVATRPESVRQAVFGAFDSPVCCESARALRWAVQQAHREHDGSRHAMQCQLAARNGL
jgi:hypothetical protein